jgi:acetyl esterase/lipase
MTIRVPFAVIAAIFALGCVACSHDDDPSAAEATRACAADGVATHRDLRYADAPGTASTMQTLDLYVPQRPASCDGPTPLVVYVHGGAFSAGDKANGVGDKVRLFTGRGWAFASLNYRLARKPGAGPTGGVYPAAEQDVAAAVAYLVDHAADYDLDPERVALLGHSAGAFLVALVGTDGTFLEQAGLGLDALACVVPVDTTYDIPQQVARGGLEGAMFRIAFGEDADRWKAQSPTGHVVAGAGIPPFHIVTRGEPGRIDQAEAFADQLTAAGVDATAVVVPGRTHEQVNDDIGRPGDTNVTPGVLTFLEMCL